MNRVKLEDNLLTTISKMAANNPGAKTVLMKMINTPEAFAPAEPIACILALDTLGIYGSDIWALGEYVCEGQNMNTLSLILSNHSYGKLSKEVLMDHIKNNEPFEKLYTEDELTMVLFDRTIPNIEQERYDRLVAEEEEQEEEFDLFSCFAPNSLHKETFASKDTYSDMPAETFIGMLKDRGFVCGCSKKLKVHTRYGSKEAEWNVFYQPETGFIMPLTVVPGEVIGYFGGSMTTQRMGDADFEGDFAIIGNSSPIPGTAIMVRSKDIRENLFAWYDAVRKSEPCLEWKTDESRLAMDMHFMDANEIRYYSECCKQLHIRSELSIFSMFQNVCTLNNMGLFDEPLQKMTSQVKSDLGAIITYSINECANFEIGHKKTKQALDYLLGKIERDYDWLTENGVDLHKAFLKNKDFSCTLQLQKPVSLNEYQKKEDTLVLELRKHLGCELNRRNGILFRCNSVPFMADKNDKLIHTIHFNGRQIGTDLSDEKLQKVVTEVLEANGFCCEPMELRCF